MGKLVAGANTKRKGGHRSSRERRREEETTDLDLAWYVSKRFDVDEGGVVPKQRWFVVLEEAVKIVE